MVAFLRSTPPQGSRSPGHLGRSAHRAACGALRRPRAPARADRRAGRRGRAGAAGLGARHGGPRPRPGDDRAGAGRGAFTLSIDPERPGDVRPHRATGARLAERDARAPRPAPKRRAGEALAKAHARGARDAARRIPQGGRVVELHLEGAPPAAGRRWSSPPQGAPARPGGRSGRGGRTGHVELRYLPERWS